MPTLTIQSIFLFYSAISALCGTLLIGLFWGRKDSSAKIWIGSCLLTSIATTGTVFRDQIPLVFSYSLMVTFETLSLLLVGQSIQRLVLGPLKKTEIFLTLSLVSGFFLTQELLRYFNGGKLSVVMSWFTAITWMLFNFLIAYRISKISKRYDNRLLLNFIIFTLIGGGVLNGFRATYMMTGYSFFAFDQKLFNIIAFFGMVLFGAFRNLSYIILRMYLGFTENNRLNNMNLGLTNMIQERDHMISTLSNLNKTASINALASTVAHEINQPLGALRLDAQLALLASKENDKNPRVLKEALDSVISNADRASKIIRTLTGLTKKSHSNNPTQVLLNTLLSEVIEISQTRCKALGIQIVISTPSDFLVSVIPGEFQQALMNVINNAIDELETYKPLEARIAISTNNIGNIVQISIQDNGRGVTIGHEESIFELLNSNKDSGSGIGLWLSKDMLSHFDGKIKYEQSNTGGANFIIELKSIV